MLPSMLITILNPHFHAIYIERQAIQTPGHVKHIRAITVHVTDVCSLEQTYNNSIVHTWQHLVLHKEYVVENAVNRLNDFQIVFSFQG
jgi:hypothetical protein